MLLRLLLLHVSRLPLQLWREGLQQPVLLPLVLLLLWVGQRVTHPRRKGSRPGWGDGELWLCGEHGEV